MRHRHAKSIRCPNCGETLRPDDNFCRICGQANHDLRIPFGHLFLELLEGFLHFDNKSFRTLSALLFKPGFLTNEFKAGKRTSYVPPIRLYVFVSFLFFLLLSWGSSTHRATAEGGSSTVAHSLKVSVRGVSSEELSPLNDTQIDSLMQARGIARTAFTWHLLHQLKRISTEADGEFYHRLLKGVSYMMFVLMPIFALLLYLFYRKRAEYYIETLVFSIHFHTFTFLLLGLYLLGDRVADVGLAIVAPPIMMVLYLYAGARRVYRQPRWLTAVKTVGILTVYGLALIGSFLLTLLASIVVS